MKFQPKRRFLAAALGAAAAVLMLELACTSKDDSAAKQNAMVVNSKSLNAKTFAERLAIKLKPFDALAAKLPENVARAKEEVLQEFINSALVQEWSDANGVTVTDAMVDEEVKKIRAQYPDDIAFRGAFANEGLSFENWKERLKQTLLEQVVFKSVTKDVKDPPEAEVLESYKANKEKFQHGARIHLRQIVVEKEDDSRRILDEIKKGKSFEKLAKEFSVGPEASKGGDVGWVEKGTLEVFDTAFTLGVGKRSDVIKSPYGYHLFEVIEKKPASQLNFDQSRATILGNLRHSKEQAEYLAWLKRQLQKAHVLRNDKVIADVTVHTEM